MPVFMALKDGWKAAKLRYSVSAGKQYVMARTGMIVE